MKGYAFIYYESVEDAKTAKEAMNGKNGQRIEVEFSKKTIPEISSCLVVFGLSADTIERELKEEFSRFGPLENKNKTKQTKQTNIKNKQIIEWELKEEFSRFRPLENKNKPNKQVNAK